MSIAHAKSTRWNVSSGGGCGFELGGGMLTNLLGIATLPEVLGTHACEERGYPEMRRHPDGVFHCPTCNAEVTPVARLGSYRS